MKVYCSRLSSSFLALSLEERPEEACLMQGREHSWVTFHGFKAKGQSQPAPMGAIPSWPWAHRLVGSEWLHNESILFTIPLQVFSC